MCGPPFTFFLPRMRSENPMEKYSVRFRPTLA
jgi:hypothetical protein